MEEYLFIGKSLFHKYLGNVRVVQIGDGRIKAEAGSRGILDFAFYDFGKVLFFDKEHAGKLFRTYNEYLEFCSEEKRIKLEEEAKAEQEREQKRIMQMLEAEKQRQHELERLKIIEEEKKKKEQLNNNSLIKNSVSNIESQRNQTFDFNSLMEGFSPKRETLLSIKKEQKNKIKEILERRKINYLVHFTRIDNLNSILMNGLVPVSIQSKQRIASVHNDEDRIDARLDCTSCSVTFPNYKLFSKFRDYKFPGTSWVIIVLSPDVLLSHDNIVYFCHTNAASVFPRCMDKRELCTASSFEGMFCESKTIKENIIINRASLQINDYIATDSQAEVLISDIIEQKYILGICFQRQNDIDRYVSENGLELLNKYDCIIYPNFFNYNIGYTLWKGN